MKIYGVIANCRKPHAPDVLNRLAGKAAELGIELVAFGETAEQLSSAQRVEEHDFVGEIDVLLALGGDGTMLRSVRLLESADIPLLGVNLGSLGFMTSVPEEELENAMDVLARGEFKRSARTRVVCEIYRNNHVVATYTALNDIVIGWGTSTRVITLGLSVNDESVTSYTCDGLIISTPTGSTGHSLAAWGPILHPESKAILINVLAPHSLSARPLVVPDFSTIDVSVLELPKEKNLILSVDGQQHESMQTGDRLVVRKHPKDIQFLHVPGYRYFSVLQQKLHWRGSSV